MTATLQPLTDVDIRILRAVNRYRFLTAAQLNRLMWPNNTRDSYRHAQRRLQGLVREDYLRVLELPQPPRGTAPHVHALGRRGRKALVDGGEVVHRYYRPCEDEEVVRN